MKTCVLGKASIGAVSVLLMVAITNDFSGGRTFIWFLLLAICSTIYNEMYSKAKEPENNIQKPETNDANLNQSTSVRLRT